MARFHPIEPSGYYVFHCPGCDMVHSIDTRWSFNGDMEKPTISPSLLVRYPTKEKMNICHSFIKEGKIQYLRDSTHELAGKTVELPEFEKEHPDWT